MPDIRSMCPVTFSETTRGTPRGKFIFLVRRAGFAQDSLWRVNDFDEAKALILFKLRISGIKIANVACIIYRATLANVKRKEFRTPVVVFLKDSRRQKYDQR